jgi:hypothetical protein
MPASIQPPRILLATVTPVNSNRKLRKIQSNERRSTALLDSLTNIFSTNPAIAGVIRTLARYAVDPHSQCEDGDLEVLLAVSVALAKDQKKRRRNRKIAGVRS